MKSRGITDFTKYRCDPNVEPPRASGASKESKDAFLKVTHNVGLVSENKIRSKL